MAEISSKELVRSLFQLKELPRTPFIPWVGTFAAQLEQIPVEDMMSDPGLLSNSLLGAQKLFGYDAIVTVFDPSLEAEACGCEVEWPEDGSLPRIVSHPLEEGGRLEDLDIPNLDRKGRIPTVLEAIKRIGIIRGKQVAIVGAVTGPLTLARHLKGTSFVSDLRPESEEATRIIAAAGAIGIKLCRRYCELGVDAIVIAEEMLGEIKPDLVQTIAAPLKSILNVIRFYGVHSLILTKGCGADSIEPILALQADGVALSGDVDTTTIRTAALKRNACCGQSIPDSVLLGTLSVLENGTGDYVTENGRGAFLTTEWEVPCATNVSTMHELMQAIWSG